MRSPRARWTVAAAASVIVLASGCTTHQLSTEPDPPLTTGDHVVLWFAGCAVMVLLAVHAVRALARTRRPLRLAAAGVIAFWVSGVGLLSVGIVAVDVRTTMILDGDDCHSVPVEDRPVTILGLSCTEGVGRGFGVVVALIYCAVAAAPAVLGGYALRGRGPWSAAVPGAVIAAAAVAALFAMLPRVGAEDARVEDTTALALALSGVLAGGMLLADAALATRAAPRARGGGDGGPRPAPRPGG